MGFLDRQSAKYGGVLVASARSWSPRLNDDEPVASSRSWSPSSAVSFPQRRPFTNAGHLNYQRQDTAKYLRSTAKPKKLLFPDLTQNSQPSSGSAVDSGFRPSPEIPSHRTEIVSSADVSASSLTLVESFKYCRFHSLE